MSDFFEKRELIVKRNCDSKKFKLAAKKWQDTSRTFDYQYLFQWFGRPIIQDPQDVMAIQEVIWQVQPDLIIETGIAHGGSLTLSASCLAAIGHSEYLANSEVKKRLVIGIDIDIREHNRLAIDQHPLKPMIQTFESSSVDPDTVLTVRNIAKKYETIMVVLDSNHTCKHVLDELKAYADLVSSKSYCIVMDTGIEEAPVDSFQNSRMWGPGNSPKTAVDKFLSTVNGKFFSIDSNWYNRFGISCAKDGFLLRD